MKQARVRVHRGVAPKLVLPIPWTQLNAQLQAVRHHNGHYRQAGEGIWPAQAPDTGEQKAKCSRTRFRCLFPNKGSARHHSGHFRRTGSTNHFPLRRFWLVPMRALRGNFARGSERVGVVPKLPGIWTHTPGTFAMGAAACCYCFHTRSPVCAESNLRQ